MTALFPPFSLVFLLVFLFPLFGLVSRTLLIVSNSFHKVVILESRPPYTFVGCRRIVSRVPIKIKKDNDSPDSLQASAMYVISPRLL